MKSDLNGIFPPIPTPFENEDIALDKLSDNIQKWNDYPLKGYLALGSNGESAYLSYDEKLKVVETTVNSAGKNKIIIAGTGLESIKDTIALTNNCSDLGVNYALVLTPSYFKSRMTHDAFISYYTEIADSSATPEEWRARSRATGVGAASSMKTRIRLSSTVSSPAILR